MLPELAPVKRETIAPAHAGVWKTPETQRRGHTAAVKTSPATRLSPKSSKKVVIASHWYRKIKNSSPVKLTTRNHDKNIMGWDRRDRLRPL